MEQNNITEIVWHGRGGQGAKTAATLLAEVALTEGKFGQGFPEYGPERMGAPMRGYTRISSEPITLHCAVQNPNIIVVLDETLIGNVDICGHMPDDGIVIVNTKLSAADMRKKLGVSKGKVFTVDATGIAIDTIKRPIPNTPMLGALVKTAGVIELETVRADMRHKFEKKFSEEVIQGNLDAIDRAYKEVKGE